MARFVEHVVLLSIPPLWGNESYMKKRGNICGILLLIIVEILLMGACIKNGTFTATARNASQSNSGSKIAMYQLK